MRSAVFALAFLALSFVVGECFVTTPATLRHVFCARSALRGHTCPLLPNCNTHSRLKMNSDPAPAAPVKAEAAKRSKARIETGYSSAQILGDAIKQSLREAAAKLPDGLKPSAVFIWINSLYCNDGLLGETTTTVDGREIRAGNEKYARAIALLSRELSQRGWTDMPVVGVSVGGNVCDDKDYEGADAGAGISITLMHVPGSTVMPFRVPDDMSESWKQSDWAKAGLDALKFPQPLLTPPYTPKDDSVIFVFAHPENPSFTRKVLDSLDFAFPRAKKVGAVAGFSLENHEAALFMLPQIKGADLNSNAGACYDKGVVGLAISGSIAADAVVAQGSRPIGPNFEVLEVDMDGTVVTKMRDISSGAMSEGPPTTLFDMAGFTGMIQQEEVLSAVNYIGLGISVTPLEDDLEKHQYIVRPITDLQKDGPISLNDQVRVGQVVRFHIRDTKNAESELASLRARWKLERASRAIDNKYPAGAFVFTDQARGRKLFGKAGVEAQGFAQDFQVALGGGFVNAAIGQLPNFAERNQEPLFKDATGTPKRVGFLFDQMEKGTYLHGVGSAYLMLYSEPEE